MSYMRCRCRRYHRSFDHTVSLNLSGQWARVHSCLTRTASSPLDLTKVRMQATGDKGMINSLRKTVRTAGMRGLFDGISGTWLRQLTYSICRFWAYDESKKLIGASTWCVRLSAVQQSAKRDCRREVARVATRACGKHG